MDFAIISGVKQLQNAFDAVKIVVCRAAVNDDADFQLTRKHNHEPYENYCQDALLNAAIANRAL